MEKRGHLFTFSTDNEKNLAMQQTFRNMGLNIWLLFLVNPTFAEPPPQPEFKPFYDNGYSDGFDAGIEYCRKSPASCGISVGQNTDGSTQAGIDQCQKYPFSCGITLGAEDGIEECRKDPKSCDIEVDQNTDGATEEGIKKCQTDPTSCNIDVTQKGVEQCQKDPASCSIDVNQNKDGSTQDGIAQCQNDPTSCGIDVNQNLDGATKDGIAQCQNDPESCGIPVNITVQEVLTQCQQAPASCGINVNNCTATSPGPTLPPGVNPIHGIYYPMHGKLSLPAVDVPSLFDESVTTYQVEMQLIPGVEPLSFSLTSVAPSEK